MDNFNADLSKALRYSMNTVENLLHQLNQPEHNETRWGHPDRSDFRGIVADALDDADRSKEAALLRTPQQHVLVSEGRVRPAKFTGSPIGRAAYAVDDFIQQHSADGQTPDFGWHSPVGSDRTGAFSVNTTELHDDYDTLHLSDAGEHLADAYSKALHHTHLITQDDELTARYQSLLHNLRTAPYEEIDRGHSSERDNGFGMDDPSQRKY